MEYFLREVIVNDNGPVAAVVLGEQNPVYGDSQRIYTRACGAYLVHERLEGADDVRGPERETDDVPEVVKSIFEMGRDGLERRLKDDVVVRVA